MPNRIEMFRRLERQYFRDRLGTWPVWKSAAWWSGR